MILSQIILLIHIIFTMIFAGFILLDRLFIRNFLKNHKNLSIEFYNFALFPLLVSLFFIISSGIWLFFMLNISFSMVFIFKIISAFLLIILFFLCPYVLKKLHTNRAKSVYRLVVLLLVIFTIIFAKLNSCQMSC